MRGHMRHFGIESNMPYEVRFTVSMSVLRVCWQLYHEGRRVFCNENEFVLLKNFGSFGREIIEWAGIAPVLELDQMQANTMPCMRWPPTDTKSTPLLAFDLYIKGMPGRNEFGPTTQIIPATELASVIQSLGEMCYTQLCIVNQQGLHPSSRQCLLLEHEACGCCQR